MIGAILFFFLFLVRLAQGGFGIPLAVQSLLAAVFLALRRRARRSAGCLWQALAWTSAFLPMLMVVPDRAAGWGLPGLALSIWALLSLGTAFDIAPADRGLVRRGPYRFMRHPMYAGELLALLPFCFVSPRNMMIFVLFSLCLVARMWKEDSLLYGGGRWMSFPKPV